MDATLLGLLCAAVTLLVILVRTLRAPLRYWAERGVRGPEPSLVVGNWWPVITSATSMGEFYTDLYRRYPEERVVGAYMMTRPVLVLRRPADVEKILVKDFSSFTDRGFETDLVANPIDDGVSIMKGNRWRAMRVKLTPTFTSGKMKAMLEEAVRCGDGLIDYLDRHPGCDHAVKSVVSVFTCEVIARCVFGVNLGAALAPDSEFVRRAKNVFRMSPLRLIKFFLYNNVPVTRRFISVGLSDPDSAAYFGAMLREVVEARRKSGGERNDFLQLLLQLKEKGSIKVQAKDPEDDYLGIDHALHQEEHIDFTDDLLMAQAFIFLTAGFDSTSTTLEYLLFELSRHPEVQEKARREVRDTLKANGTLSYAALSAMTFLECCVKECLRVHSIAPTLQRECTKDYVLEGGVHISAGDFVVVPTQGYHTDPQYFEDPEEFRPERFLEETPRMTYLPFGLGPRMCIGMRFAMVNVKLGLAIILSNFRVDPSPKTEMPLRVDPNSLVSSSLRPVYCKLARIQ